MHDLEQISLRAQYLLKHPDVLCADELNDLAKWVNAIASLVS